MPRLAVGKEEMQNRILKGAIENRLAIVNMTKPELAKKTGIPESSLYSKIRNPSKFNLADLRKVFVVLRMPEEEKERLARESI